MTQTVEITDVRSLDEFRNLIKPIAQAAYDRVANLPKEPGKIRINIEPETCVEILTDEFVQILPEEYVNRSESQMGALRYVRQSELRKTIPAEVVADTIGKMKTVVLV